ncbi:50S ribosomal protein L18 [Elusimicrobiota bacterium]
MKDTKKHLKIRRARIRKKISGTSERPRLCVVRGHKHTYAQIIDDSKHCTLVEASTLSKDVKGKLKTTDTIPAAKAVGEAVAKKSIEKGIKKVVFDRSGRDFVGRIKALADAAREAGLDF